MKSLAYFFSFSDLVIFAWRNWKHPRKNWVDYRKYWIENHMMNNPAWGGMCSIGSNVPNTAFIFRAFVAIPRTLSYLCIFSSFCLALNLSIQVVNSPSYSITWIFLSKILTDDDDDTWMICWFNAISFHLDVIERQMITFEPIQAFLYARKKNQMPLYEIIM